MFNGETDCDYMKPIRYLSHLDQLNRFAFRNRLTDGLSKEENADIERSKAIIEHYKKIYNIYEYSTDLHTMMYNLE